MRVPASGYNLTGCTVTSGCNSDFLSCMTTGLPDCSLGHRTCCTVESAPASSRFPWMPRSRTLPPAGSSGLLEFFHNLTLACWGLLPAATGHSCNPDFSCSHNLGSGRSPDSAGHSCYSSAGRTADCTDSSRSPSSTDRSYCTATGHIADCTTGRNSGPDCSFSSGSGLDPSSSCRSNHSG